MDGFSYTGSVAVLSAMTCLSLFLSFFLYRKSRIMMKLPKDLKVSVFDKTFNVINPYPENRKMIHNIIASFPFSGFIGGLIVAYFIINLFSVEGLVLGMTTFIVCLGLMMIDEVFEMRKDINTLAEAIRKGSALGVGDLAAVYLVRKTLRRFSAYYVSLIFVFLACALALPLVVPTVLAAFSQVVGVMYELTTSAGMIAPFCAALLFAIAGVGVQVAARKAKGRIFGLPDSSLLISAASASVRQKLTYEKLSQVLESNPEEITW